MNLIRITLLSLGLLTFPVFAQQIDESSESAIKASVSAQPSDIPGDFEIKDMPWPDLAGILEKAEANPYVCGLYTWRGEYVEHRQSMKDVGWKAYRFAGPFDDEIMRMIVEDDISTMWTLGSHVTGEPKQRPDYETDEAFIEDYLSGVTKFLDRYGPGGSFFKENADLPNRPIVYVEIWNEPNFQYMIPNDATRDRVELETEREKLYAKLLPAAYEHIKKGWPDVKVVGFGTGGASLGDLRFIEHVHDFNEKVKSSYDVLSTHPYVRPVPPETHKKEPWGGYSIIQGLDLTRKVLAKHEQGDATIWYTEIGWPISKADGGYFDTPKGKIFVDPMLQAAYVCRLYAIAQRLGIERINIMFATDTDNFNGGFFLRDGSWRPSAHAVQNMIRLMPSPKLVGVDVDGVDGIYVYRFNPGSTGDYHVVMAWKVDGPGQVEIECKGIRARVIDMLGGVKVVRAEEGKVKLDIGPLPVYVIVE